MFADPEPDELIDYTVDAADGILCHHQAATGRSVSGGPSMFCVRVRQVKRENSVLIASTGTTLWRATEAVCAYLTVAVSKAAWREMCVLELGAGLGVCGLLMHWLGAADLTITDGDTDTLQRLRETIAANPHLAFAYRRQPLPAVKQLRWGSCWLPAKYSDFFLQPSTDPLVSASPLLTMIVGSDVIYVPRSIVPIFETVTGLFLLAAHAAAERQQSQHQHDEQDKQAVVEAVQALCSRQTFVLGFTKRNVSIDDVFDAADARGMLHSKWQQHQAASDGCTLMFEFRWKQSAILTIVNDIVNTK